jgi:endogenous inhibitor of DNA gyrase (YacG/DUF329 family)
MRCIQKGLHQQSIAKCYCSQEGCKPILLETWLAERPTVYISTIKRKFNEVGILTCPPRQLVTLQQGGDSKYVSDWMVMSSEGLEPIS